MPRKGHQMNDSLMKIGSIEWWVLTVLQWTSGGMVLVSYHHRWGSWMLIPLILYGVFFYIDGRRTGPFPKKRNP